MTTRIVLSMDESQAREVKEFSKKSKFTSVAETMRKAYELLKLVKESEKIGYEMILRKKDDHQKERVVVL